jgi:hypothetical protein
VIRHAKQKQGKNIQVLGLEDKKQITTIISSSTNGMLFTFTKCVSKDKQPFTSPHE